jgi:low affinity Fe/Cu permease
MLAARLAWALAWSNLAMEHHHRVRSALSRFAQVTTATVGSGVAAAVALLLAAGWLVVGFVSGFTEEWHRIVHTVAGLVTFVMVFVIQHATNRESRAVLLKLDELVRATDDARNAVINVESRPLREQEQIEEQLDPAAAAEEP